MRDLCPASFGEPTEAQYLDETGIQSDIVSGNGQGSMQLTCLEYAT